MEREIKNKVKGEFKSFYFDFPQLVTVGGSFGWRSCTFNLLLSSTLTESLLSRIYRKEKFEAKNHQSRNYDRKRTQTQQN